MTSNILKATAIGSVAIVTALSLGGCASHKFVRENLAVVDSRVTQVDGHVTQVEGTAKDALDRANAAHKLAEGKFLFEMVLSDDSVKFPLDRHSLSPEAEARLAEMVQRLKGENKNVYLEIQGHTDATGDVAYNDKLGEARAEAVRRFLSKQGIALNRMATISYGEEAPAAENSTREGRAQNRRVVIVVLA